MSSAGLQDNPWVCDCRISKLIELSKMSDTSVVLMDQFLSCSGPENLAGVMFQRVELDQCLKPSVMMSATKITASVGSNVLLRCDTTGYPTPTLIWTTSDGSRVNNTGINSETFYYKKMHTVYYSTCLSKKIKINKFLC